MQLNPLKQAEGFGKYEGTSEAVKHIAIIALRSALFILTGHMLGKAAGTVFANYICQKAASQGLIEMAPGLTNALYSSAGAIYGEYAGVLASAVTSLPGVGSAGTYLAKKADII